MGYDAASPVYELDLAERFPGMVVRARGCSLGEALTFVEFLDIRMTAFQSGDLAARRDALFEAFLARLVDWNLELDGEPVPHTLAGMHSVDWQIPARIVEAWIKAMTVIEDPLEQRSPNGDTSEALSIPMETL